MSYSPASSGEDLCKKKIDALATRPAALDQAVRLGLTRSILRNVSTSCASWTRGPFCSSATILAGGCVLDLCAARGGFALHRRGAAVSMLLLCCYARSAMQCSAVRGS